MRSKSCMERERLVRPQENPSYCVKRAEASVPAPLPKQSHPAVEFSGSSEFEPRDPQ